MKNDDSAATGETSFAPPAPAPEKESGTTSITRIVTTSWDDGDPFDLRVAEMLAARGLPGTFYIPLKGHHKFDRMSFEEMRKIDSQGFEIGGHGVSHPNLPGCDAKQLMIEVDSCKKRLEDDLGKTISMFAYPRGRHNRKVIAALKKSGYAGARTTAMLAHQLEFDPYRMPTSVHAFPHSRVDYLRNLPRAWDMRRAWVYATNLRCAANWIEFAKLIFDSVLSHGGLWHLYGHSWEIEELRLWEGLAEVLDYVSNRPGVLYLSNGPVVNQRAEKSVGAERCLGPTPEPLVEGQGIQAAQQRRLGV